MGLKFLRRMWMLLFSRKSSLMSVNGFSQRQQNNIACLPICRNRCGCKSSLSPSAGRMMSNGRVMDGTCVRGGNGPLGRGWNGGRWTARCGRKRRTKLKNKMNPGKRVDGILLCFRKQKPRENKTIVYFWRVQKYRYRHRTVENSCNIFYEWIRKI